MKMDRRGFEPRSSGCKPDIFPLDEQPVENTFKTESGPGWSRTTVASMSGWRRTV